LLALINAVALFQTERNCTGRRPLSTRMKMAGRGPGLFQA
jgi:hypothetical protein